MAVHHVFHVGTFLLFVAVVLLLFTTISAPIIHNDAFLKVTLTNSTAGGQSAVSFGALGYCVFNTPSGTYCSNAHIKYDIANVVGTGTGQVYISRSLYTTTGVLILHPILTGLTFIALIIAMGASCCGFIMASFLAMIAWVMTLVVLIVDFSLFGSVRSHVIGLHSGARAEYGVAIWLTVAAFVVLFFASVMTCCACFTDRRSGRSRVPAVTVPSSLRNYYNKAAGSLFPLSPLRSLHEVHDRRPMATSIASLHPVASSAIFTASSLTLTTSSPSSSILASTSSPAPSPTSSSSEQNGDLATSGALYLYTFLATLVLLLSVSSAIVIRSLAVRRRHNRMIAESIANGTWFPNSNTSQPVGEKPGFFEAFVAGPKLDGEVKTASENEDVDWHDIMPFSATYVITPPSESDGTKASSTPAGSTATIPAMSRLASAIRRARSVPRTPTALLPLPVSSRQSNPSSPLTPPAPSPPFSAAPPPLTSSMTPNQVQTEQAAPDMEVLPSSTLRVAVLIAMPVPPSSQGSQASRSAYGDDEEEIPHLEFGVTDVDVVDQDTDSAHDAGGAA